MNWIDNSKRKPKKGGEYNVVWNLKDNQYPTVTTMNYCAIEKKWTDVLGAGNECTDVLYWANMPKPPKGINKNIWKNE